MSYVHCVVSMTHKLLVSIYPFLFAIHETLFKLCVASHSAVFLQIIYLKQAAGTMDLTKCSKYVDCTKF